MSTDQATPAAHPITDYAALLKFLATLPPPAAGKVRVYRGQTKNFPQMLASGSRPVKPPNTSLFDFSTRIVAQDLLQGPIDTDLELDMMMFWIQAVAQHYGPSSWYLDVTHSLEVALWFALFAPENSTVRMLYGPGDKPDPKVDIVRSETWVRFKRAEAPGYLYVFDAPKFKSSASVQHGDLVDLAEAPPVFSSSRRMQAQKACLLACGTGPQQADLSDCFLTPPILVNWPMAGAPGLDRATEDIFPGPTTDEWYRRFLSIPLVPSPDPDEPARLSIGHPVPVSIYLTENEAGRKQVMECAYGLEPALMYSTLADQKFLLPDPETKQPVEFSSHDATLLVMEGPVRYLTPPADNPGWNQGLLCSDISDNVPVYDHAEKVVGNVPLNNVFMEFSPLESATLSRPEGTFEDTILRGAWLVRNSLGMALDLFYQQLPGGGIMEARIEAIRLNPNSGSLYYAAKTNTPTGEKTEWRELAQVPMIAKPLFAMLFVLREISPIWKASPFPSLVVDAGTDSQKMMVDVSDGSARLLRVQDVRTGRFLQFVRSRNLTESFAAPSPESALTMEGNYQYARLDPDWIRSSIGKG